RAPASAWSETGRRLERERHAARVLRSARPDLACRRGLRLASGEGGEARSALFRSRAGARGRAARVDDPRRRPLSRGCGSGARGRRVGWGREARFGMFIHWGLYAVPAGEYKGQRSTRIGEWIMEWANIPRREYEQFAPQFNPVKFDAAKWVGIAKDAGMKYIV